MKGVILAKDSVTEKVTVAEEVENLNANNSIHMRGS